VRGKARSLTGHLGDWPEHPATHLVCPSRQSHLGWQPSRFLAHRTEAERAFRLAEQLGSKAATQFLGVVEDVGSEVTGLQRGDLVVTPFVWADNTCDFCTEGLQTSCRHGGRYGLNGVDGGQGEAVRVPQAQGTLVKLPVGEGSELLPSLLALSDVFASATTPAERPGSGRAPR